jgi:hypothetical protein
VFAWTYRASDVALTVAHRNSSSVATSWACADVVVSELQTASTVRRERLVDRDGRYLYAPRLLVSENSGLSRGRGAEECLLRLDEAVGERSLALADVRDAHRDGLLELDVRAAQSIERVADG